jgi:hypothetical protein
MTKVSIFFCGPYFLDEELGTKLSVRKLKIRIRHPIQIIVS